MARCRCSDINNANTDLKKLTATRDYLGEVWQASRFTISGALDRLAKDVQNSATPNNSSIFQSIESKLGQPLQDNINKLYDKCVNKISVLPREIQKLYQEDSSYHDAVTAKNYYTYSRK